MPSSIIATLFSCARKLVRGLDTVRMRKGLACHLLAMSPASPLTFDVLFDDLFDELIDPDLSSRLFNFPMKVENLYIQETGLLKQDDQINPVAEEVINWLFETELEHRE
jgi:hypothetical protein